jgi:protoporphyrinogen oxidase
MAQWGIVGGGLLGMTLAHRLRRRGEAVTLIEAAGSLGGLASAWSLGDVVWDRFYHVILLSDSRLLGLLEELGLADELRFRGTRTGFFTNGTFHSMSSTREFLTFPPLNPLERLRLALTILRASRIRDWKALERVPAAAWLARWSGHGTLEKIWLPLLRAKLGESHTRTSAAFIWATIARMYAARRTGHKREMFGYVAGGYSRILERFSAVLREEGVGIELGSRTHRVERTPAGRIAVEETGGRRREFERVVLTLAPPAVLGLCPGLSDDERRLLRRVEYVGIVCASLLLARPLAGYYVTNITDEGFPFTAVIETSALVDPSELGGRTLVYLPKYVPPEDALFSAPEEEIRRSFLDGLGRMYPALDPGDVRAFRVARAAHVFALPTLGYSEHVPPIVTSTPGLYLVNSAQIVNGTLNVNETITLAERALEVLEASAAGGTP